MSDERVERIRAYLQSNGVYGRDDSDLSYLVMELDVANRRIAELKALHNAGLNTQFADMEKKDDITAHDKLAGDI